MQVSIIEVKVSGLKESIAGHEICLKLAMFLALDK